MGVDCRCRAGGCNCTLAFVYGTLKSGFANNWLLQDLISSGHATFMGNATTKHQYPLVCGPFQVPFLLNFQSRGRQVDGEVYLVDDHALLRLDELEGVSKGHYERRPIIVQSLKSSSKDLVAQAYFASPAYAAELLVRAPHLKSFSALEAATYVRRKDRPHGVTFLEHIRAWIASKPSKAASEAGNTTCPVYSIEFHEPPALRGH